jgi:hypothetical protein
MIMRQTLKTAAVEVLYRRGRQHIARLLGRGKPRCAKLAAMTSNEACPSASESNNTLAIACERH